MKSQQQARFANCSVLSNAGWADAGAIAAAPIYRQSKREYQRFTRPDRMPLPTRPSSAARP